MNLLTESFPTSAGRFRRDVGWGPTYPTYREGIDRIVETWMGDGTIREAASGYEWTGERAARERDASAQGHRA